MSHLYITPEQAVINADEYGEALINRASSGDRSTANEVETILANPAHPYYSAVSSRLGRLMGRMFGWYGNSPGARI